MRTPKFKNYNGSELLVIFIHGFMGSPGQFDDLAETAYKKGCSVLSIVLPGHSGSGKHFVNSSLIEWETHLQNEISKYRDHYSQIYLVGHSMGGLLALNASIVKANKICGVLMLSSPMRIAFISPDSLRCKFKLLFSLREREIRKRYTLSNSIDSDLLYCLLLLKPFQQLKALMQKTEHNLSDVFTPVTMIHSKNDEMVAFESAKILYDGLSNTTRKSIALQNSSHAYYPADEREKIGSELLTMIH